MIGNRIDCIHYLMDAKEMKYEVKEHREKRSLSQNAYYWVMITKLSAVLTQRNAVTHNLMLRDYGQIEVMNGRAVNVIIPDSEDADKKALQAETFHIKPTSQVINGFRNYVLLRGSSTYNSDEMSKLLNGLIAECQSVGIETLPPDELRRMYEQEKANEKHKDKGVCNKPAGKEDSLQA